MKISSTITPVKFGAWATGNASQQLHHQIDQIEETLETPPSMPQSSKAGDYPKQHQPAIAELKATLAEVTKDNGYGMADAIKALKVLRETGYQPTAKEAEKIKILIRKSEYNLLEHITHFPKSGYFDYESSRQTQEDLNLLIPEWVKLQTDYRSIVKLVNTIDRSSKFVASAESQEAISTALQTLQAQLNDPEVHRAVLGQLGNSFRLQSAIAKDIQTVMDYLYHGNDGLFQADFQQEVQQAVQLVAKRNQKIDFAGRTADGKLYIITSSTDQMNTGSSIYYGDPGQLRKLTRKDWIRARDGSFENITTEEGVTFVIQRGGLFDFNDKSKWSASVNGVPVAAEFPTDELAPQNQ